MVRNLHSESTIKDLKKNIKNNIEMTFDKVDIGQIEISTTFITVLDTIIFPFL